MTQPQAQARPQAFLALWNSISRADLQPEYEAWHTFEHVPERVGMPGFIEAHRFRSFPQDENTPPAYFTCYWLTSCKALSTPQYKDVVAFPTAWSARMRLALRDFLRVPCELLGSCGNSSAAKLATLRLRPRPGGCAQELGQALQQRVDDAELVCAHWGLAQGADDFPLANAGPTGPHDLVLMLQHIDRGALQSTASSLLRQLGPVAELAGSPSYFELLSIVRQADLDSPLNARQPSKPHLLHRFAPEREALPGDKP